MQTLNKQMDLGLTWHDAGYHLKSRSTVVRLVSCLPKSNKGMKNDYVIASREWHDGLHYSTREGELGGVS